MPSQSFSAQDAIVYNALRFTVTTDEYKALHKRLPSTIKKRTPQPGRYREYAHGDNEYFATTVRYASRLFLASQSGLQAWDLIAHHLIRRGKPSRSTPPKTPPPLLSSPNVRLSLSLGTVLFLHRTLHRFFTQLHTHLASSDAAPFRRRNPLIARALLARLTPALAASLAGFALGLYRGAQLRLTVAIYVATRAAEFAYEALEADGWLRGKPEWVGSWMLMPLAYGQLLQAAVLERDCFPKSYGDFNLDWSPRYVERRPLLYPAEKPWPKNDEVFEGLAEMTRMKWPPFVSPILFPNAILPPTLTPISPVVSSAHPALQSLSCALLHPHEPSCLQTYLAFFPRAIVDFAKFWTVFYALFLLPRYQSVLRDPSHEGSKLARRVLRSSVFLAGSIGTAWGSICLGQNFLPRTLATESRWFWGGFLGGLWAFVDRRSARGTFMYSVRASLDSWWKVGVKKGWWSNRGGKDLWVLVASLALLNVVFELRPEAIKSGVVRKGLGMMMERERARTGKGKSGLEKDQPKED